MAELKPCPFCGRKAELRHNKDGFSYVVCANLDWKREHDIKVAKLRKAHELDIEVDLYRAKRRVKMQRLKGRVKRCLHCNHII